MYKSPGSTNSSRKIVVVTVIAMAVIASVGAFLIDRLWRPIENASVRLRRVTTLAGFHREFSEPFGVAVRDGVIYVSDGEAGTISKVTSGGQVSTFAAGLKTPSAIAFTSTGDLIIADSGDHAIKRIDPDGNVSIVAGTAGQSGFADGPASVATFNGPVGVAVGSENRIFVSDTYNDRIRVIENGSVSTLSGGPRGFADGAGQSSKFDTPLGIATRSDGSVLVADSRNARIRVVDIYGNTATIAGLGRAEITDGSLSTASFADPTAVAIASSGDIFVADGDAVRVIRNGAFPIVRTLAGTRRGYSDGGLSSARFNRVSGVAIDAGGLVVTDSDNQTLRLITGSDKGSEITANQLDALRLKADEFKSQQPPRWPYDPPYAVREIAGTLGELRGSADGTGIDSPRFHNGLDIAGGYGEHARFVRTETVLLPTAAENFETTRELVRLPGLGYIHIRLGRNSSGMPYGDPRFQFTRDAAGRLSDVRIARGTVFNAGEVLGSLNSMNHVHLVAGRSGAEINALAALGLPGVADSIEPVIEEITLLDEQWRKIETRSAFNRIRLTGKTRIAARAYDRVDGNAERRRLGLYRLGYRLTKVGQPAAGIVWNIQFDRMPPAEAARFVYAPGSRSGATGETVFNYIVTNSVGGGEYQENFIDPAALDAGNYKLEIFAADFFGNTTVKAVGLEILK